MILFTFQNTFREQELGQTIKTQADISLYERGPGSPRLFFEKCLSPEDKIMVGKNLGQHWMLRLNLEC